MTSIKVEDIDLDTFQILSINIGWVIDIVTSVVSQWGLITYDFQILNIEIGWVISVVTSVVSWCGLITYG